ncbi:MAG TPA: hypothetical protein ENN54_02585 [Thermoplasmatales archaeon]|nr:hypothetical protein [Candidatus Thermoplasmatota archaeon]HDS59167.1 hypothetical protein [Thermoplasmatales archaeon]
MAMQDMASTARELIMLVVSTIVLVILGLIFFTIDVWIVDTAADLLNLAVNGDWVVVSAAILSAAAMIGSRHK